MTASQLSIFNEFTFAKGITLRNRIVMAPMTTWSANPDGTISQQELDYYQARAKGVGLVVTGCTHVMRNGIGFTDEFAAYDDSFIPSLTHLAKAAKSGGAKAILQIFHAGNKANPALIPDGDMVSASAMKASAGPFNSGVVASRELSHDEILDVINAFGETTRRAIEAGFDGVELHGAHGFLIQNFFSPAYNKRSDIWGGSPENRMRFPIAVVRELRRVIDTYADRPFLLGYRLSPEESEPEGLRLADTEQLIDKLIDEQVDYLHASLWDVLTAVPQERSSDTLIAELIIQRAAGRVPVMAAGHVRTPVQADAALSLGLSLVAVGKGLVINPTWVELAQSQQDDRIDTTLRAEKVQDLEIPEKLWDVIQSTTGWFPLETSDTTILA